MEDPLAKGKRRTNYTKSQGADKAWTLKPESEWIYTEVEPVVSPELWDECFAILTSQKRSRPPAKKQVHLFSGKVFCKGCDTKMYPPSWSPKYLCRSCRAKIPPDVVETIFVEQLKGFFLSPDEVAGYLAQGDEILTEKERLLAALEQERARVVREMNQLYQLYLDRTISSQGFGERNTPLEERRLQLDDEIPRLQGEVDYLRIEHLGASEIVTHAQDIYSNDSPYPVFANEARPDAAPESLRTAA